MKNNRNVINAFLFPFCPKVDEKTRIMIGCNPGFTLTPTLKRMSDYKFLKGGYSEFTWHKSDGGAALGSEWQLA